MEAPVIRTGYNGDLYLACPWDSEYSQVLAWRVVKTLDMARYRAIGDVPKVEGLKFEEPRIRRIMQHCSGFIAVLPYDDAAASTTSKYIIRELRIAGEMEIPVLLFREHEKVNVGIREKGQYAEIFFPGDPSIEPILCKQSIFHAAEQNNYRSDLDPWVQIQLKGLLAVCNNEISKPKPYAFFIGRLKDDFQQARQAVETAVYNHAGISCLWANDAKHSLKTKGIQETIKTLIYHARFVIADLSFSDDNPNFFSPNCAHEVGIAVAYDKPVFLCAKGASRSPYFSARDLQMSFWKDELQLEDLIAGWIQNNVADFSRQVYNWQLTAHIPGYVPSVAALSFNYDPLKAFQGL